MDPPKLRHEMEALAAKGELLRKLDEEIVEVVHEDELEEVEGAYTVQEHIELIIIELDSEMNAATDKLRLEAEYPEGTLHERDCMPPNHTLSQSHLMKNRHLMSHLTTHQLPSRYGLLPHLHILTP